MNAKYITTRNGVIVRTVLVLLAGMAHASTISVTVVQADGKALPGAVVVAESHQSYAATRNVPKATIDQRNLMFVPEYIVVRTGTAVDFPNSDQVRHQVYSFSGAKTFQLPLYAGRTQPPVTFDRAGLVTLGCNIHDGMIGYIYVTDSPWFGKTDAKGELQLVDLPAGDYTLKVWQPRMDKVDQRIEQPIKLDEAQTVVQTVRLTKPVKGEAHHHQGDKRWQDY